MMIGYADAPILLDNGTFLFCVSVFGVVMAILCRSASSALSTNIQGLKEWGMAMLMYSIAMQCIFLRGHIHPFISYLLANLAITIGGICCFLAYCNYYKRTVPYYFITATAGPGILGTVVCYIYDLPNPVLVFFGSYPSCVFLFGVVYFVVRYSGKQKSLLSTKMAMLSIFFLASVLLLRCVKVLMLQGASVSLDAQSPTQIGFYLGVMLAVNSASLGIILMAHDRHKNDILDSSRRDGLTGLFTRSAFFESASALDAAGKESPYSVIMLDIDHFKNINDTHGHAIGDLAIIHAARLIAKSIRATDMAGRYGGEEFCILLQDCDKGQAGVLAKRVIEEADKNGLRLPNGEELKFTISAGFACHKDLAMTVSKPTIKELLDTADKALYVAKHNGRNQAIAA